MSAFSDEMLRVLAADACPPNNSEYEASGEDSDDEPMTRSTSGSDSSSASDDKSERLLEPGPPQSTSIFKQDAMNLLRSSSFLPCFNTTYLASRPATPLGIHEEEKGENEKQG
ncbi:hypothetical protein GRF29_1536g1231679 [Pseudopithomyces chartarum]|uniref:Uncharacterized protein n=1 Tax=Pseudopithomyces chartarum TaxID=1892770 RepID=A0AAN6LLW8_9PLEO|nr:hypothetical protein GRF29_1536g1231679 [Pseudopithomyces chartarum]